MNGAVLHSGKFMIVGGEQNTNAAGKMEENIKKSLDLNSVSIREFENNIKNKINNLINYKLNKTSEKTFDKKDLKYKINYQYNNWLVPKFGGKS